jgi:hypothetical protein
MLLFLGNLLAFLPQQLPEKGVPLLKNYSPADYNHKGKIWDIDTAPNGIVYMASNKGILEYDGKAWKNYSGSDGITRSVTVMNDSLVYTGSDRDFGVWKRNDFKEFEYTSLYPFREDMNQVNEEFWNVHYLNENVFFVSAENIYIYRGESLTKISAPSEIQNSFIVNGTLFFMDEEEGLYEFQNLSPKQISGSSQNNIPEVIGMYEQEDRLILVTQNSGLVEYINGEMTPINSPLSEDLKAANVFSFEKISDTHLAFGTILKGLYVSDINWNILHHVNKNKGMQNNTVLSLHQSDNGKLWLGMDYGVSYLDLSNEYTYFYDYRGNFGTGSSGILRGDQFYLGTNQGLYKTNWEDLNNYNSEFDDFEIIPGSEGQVWSLNTFEDRIWVGHDRGLFILENDQLNRVHDQRGVWTIQPYEDYLLAGTYNGISIFRKEAGEWKYWKQMDLILGSCNQILLDGDNVIWVNIPNYGVIKATLDDALNPVEREIFLSEEFSGEGHYLNSEEAGIKVLTDVFSYGYDHSQNTFEKQDRSDKNYKLEDLVDGIAQPKSLNSDFEFYPVYNGFAIKHLSMDKSDGASDYQIVFRNFEIFNNEESRRSHSGAEIHYQFNNVRIESIVPNQRYVTYQFKTEDSGSWSEWQDNGTTELIGLKHGDHELSARALIGGEITSAATIRFEILPPWYLTWYAYVFYVLLAYSLVWAIYFWQGMTLKRQRKHLLTDHRKSLQKQGEKYQEKIKRAEEAKLKAEFEQIKEQLKSKTIELATKAKENDEKNKILQSLDERLKIIEENPASLKRRLSEIHRIVKSHINSEDNTFEIQIDELHQDFYDALRKEFSDLTRYDLRLCAYIKIGFDSKEISDLLNIKPSSVYISRSRLRKKLNIESDEDLHGYLNTL